MNIYTFFRILASFEKMLRLLRAKCLSRPTAFLAVRTPSPVLSVSSTYDINILYYTNRNKEVIVIGNF